MSLPSEDRISIIDNLIDDLCEHSYPVELMKKDYKVYSDHFVDLAIVDVTGEPIAFFKIADESWDKTKETLISIAKRIKEPYIPCFVVNPSFTGDKQNYDLMFLRPLVSGKRHLLSVHGIESASQLIIPYIVLNKRSLHKQITQTTKEAKLISVLLGLSLLLILILKLQGIIRLDGSDLFIITLIVGMFIFPYIAKLKVLWFEIERGKKNL